MNYIHDIYQGRYGRRLGILAVFLALAGCSLPQLPHRSVAMLQTAHLQAGAPFDQRSEALIRQWPGPHWWHRLDDAELDHLIGQALSRSPDLQVAQARIRAAVAQSGIAGAALKPQMNAALKPSYNRFTADEFIPPPFAGHNVWDNQVLLEGGYELDLWGKNHAALRASLDQVHAQRAESRQVEQVLIASIVDAYLQLRYEDPSLLRLHEEIELRQQLLRLSQRRRQVGLGTDLELSGVAAALPPLQRELARRSAHQARLRHQLALLCGLPSIALAPPPATLAAAPTQLAAPGKIPLDWLGRRPDLMAARWQVEADGEDIHVAKARFYPDISLSAAIGYQALGFSQLFSPSAELYSVSPTISLPLFEGGRLQAGLDAAAARRDADIARYNALLLRAIMQVSDHMANLQGLQQEQQAAEQARNLAQERERLSQSGLQAGLIDMSAPLEARILRLHSEQALADLDLRTLQEDVALIRDTGAGDHE